MKNYTFLLATVQKTNSDGESFPPYLSLFSVGLGPLYIDTGLVTEHQPGPGNTRV